MAKKYMPNKVPMENKLDARYPSSAHNERYLNVQGGGMGNGVMGHASRVMEVNPMPNYDINRVNYLPFQEKDTPRQAFDYEY